MRDEYKAALRDFMERKGRPVHFTEGYNGGKDVSPYGWPDDAAENHIFSYDRVDDGSKYGKHVKVFHCGWIVPEGAVLTEETYSQFLDTFSGNEEEVGINVEGCHCKCGKYQDVTLRFAGSLGDVLRGLFNTEDKPGITL